MDTRTNRSFRLTSFAIVIIVQFFSMQSTLSIIEAPLQRSHLSMYYDMLGINEHATPKQIKSAYQALMKKNNPEHEKQDEKDMIESELDQHEIIKMNEDLHEAYTETIKIARQNAIFYDKLKELSIGKFITTPTGSTILHTYHSRLDNTNNRNTSIEENQTDEINENIASDINSSDYIADEKQKLIVSTKNVAIMSSFNLKNQDDKKTKGLFLATNDTALQDSEDKQPVINAELNTQEESLDEETSPVKVIATELMTAAINHAYKYYTAIQAKTLDDENKIEDKEAKPSAELD